MINKVRFLVLPGVEILDLAGPVQVFYTANQLGAAYELSYLGPSAKVFTAQGLGLQLDNRLPAVDSSTLVLIPGVAGAPGLSVDRKTLRWVHDAYLSGAEVCSVCSGAFVLGAAGLLEGRRCTTHWSLTRKLKHAFPGADVQEAALFVEDERLISSAGIASGIDMALAIVERHHGPIVAAKAAREMVVYLRRDGSQRQTSIYLQYRTHLHPGVHRVQDWLIRHFAEPVRLDQLGRIAGVSGRQLARLFKVATGLTPLAYQQRLRLELASSLLRNPGLTMEAIAARCGFEDARSLRRLWSEAYGHAPSAHRSLNISV